MQSLNDSVKEYTVQLELGQIQKAYKGIMTFMSGLKTYHEGQHHDFSATFPYTGMDWFSWPGLLPV